MKHFSNIFSVPRPSVFQLTLFKIVLAGQKMKGKLMVYNIQGVPKKPQTFENNLLLEFQWPSTKLNPRVHKLLT